MYTCDVVQPEDRYVLIAGIIAAVVLNIVLGLISWWRCYANNYLHWGALATWCLLLVQGCVFYGLRAKRDQEDLIRPTQQLYGFETFIWLHHELNPYSDRRISMRQFLDSSLQLYTKIQ